LTSVVAVIAPNIDERVLGAYAELGIASLTHLSYQTPAISFHNSRVSRP
jgi:hypothetical protein